MHVCNQGTKSGMLDCGVVVVDKCNLQMLLLQTSFDCEI